MTSSNVRDEFDEPPPYTPRPDTSQGETTVEYGPQRPYRPPPQRPQLSPRPTQSPHFLSPHPTGSSYRTAGRGSSIWQQLTEQMDQIANQITTHATGTNSHYTRSSLSPHPTGSSWSTYPGQTHPQAEHTPSSNTSLQPPPPLPPRHSSVSSVSLPEDMTDFARDFYASGAGDQHSPDNRGLQNTSSAPSEERGPTVTPVPGRPLLKEGKLLVYPRGYTCEKCHNTGYKHYDPLHPCKRCWSKYAKPFTGPLAYSYSSPSSSSSNTRNISLQQPLLMLRPSSSRSLTPPPRPVSIRSLPTGIPPPNTWYPNPALATVSGYVAPPPGAVVYQPGDPRIGGSLCWRCNGKGTMSIFIDRISCPVCGGCGRTF